MPIEKTCRLLSPAAGANDQLVRGQTRGEGLDNRKRGAAALVENRPATNLQDVGVGQHAEDRDFRRPLDLLVEQAFAHQHRFQMVAFVLMLCSDQS